MSLLSRKFIQILGVVQKYSYTNKCVRFASNKDITHRSTINQDILYHSLKNASSTQNIFDLVATHHKIMNNKHLMQAFRSLFSAQKNASSDVLRKEVLSHPDFKKLCQSLKAQVRSIDLNEVVDALKVLNYVGVPSNSTIVQILLQITRHNINNMKLQQIIFLEFLLNQFNSTPLSDALLIAFPIVFEAQLVQKVCRDNIQHLTDLLQYAAKNKLNDSTITFIINAIQANRDLDSRAAMSLVWSLCDLKPMDEYEPLLKRALKVMVKHGHELKMADLETTLTKLTYRYNHSHMFYYQKEFYDMVADHVVHNDAGFQQTMWILQKFSKVGYTNHGLLDYISTLSHDNSKLISNSNSWNLFTLVTGFAATEYKAVHWESVRQGILENEQIYETKREFNWIKYATRLIILDIFIPKVFEKAFKNEYIQRLAQDGTYISCQNYLFLHQTIQTLHPEYLNLLPDGQYLQDVYNYAHSSWAPYEPLQGALERGVGGKSYVLTNVTTKLHHFLHYVVVMRKGGYPIGINYSKNNEQKQLENLELPNDNHIIAIFGCDSSYYNPDGTTLSTYYNLLFRTIEATGCSVVPICIESWVRLLDHEKIPYLMRAIQAKNEEFQNRFSVVQ